MLNGTNHMEIVEVKVPTVTTEDTLTVSLVDDFGYDAAQVAAFRDARLLSKQVAAGTGQVLDDSVALSGNNLVITEGSTGFTTGDVFQVALFTALPSKSGTASAA